MPRGSGSPTSTCVYRIGFLKPVSSWISSTRPVTSGPVTSEGRWISSTSRPMRTKVASRVSTVVPAGMSTYSASQPMGTLTCSAPPGDGWSLFHPECRGETDVALDDVAYVADARPELQGAFDAHAEREAGVLVGVDAARDEHPGVDHPAATPLDPARAVAMLGEPDVVLGRRLGEREVRRPPAGARVGAEQRPGQLVQRAAQVRHGQPAVDRQALDLVEDRGVRRVELVRAVDAAGRHDVDGRRPGQHRA